MLPFFLSESFTPEREVGGSVPSSAVLCPLLRESFTEEVWARRGRGDRDGHRDLGLSFVNCRHYATIWPLMSNL